MDPYKHDFTLGPVCAYCGRSQTLQETDPVTCTARPDINEAAAPSVPVPAQAEVAPMEVDKPGFTSIIVAAHMRSYPLFHYTGHCLGSVREHTNLPFEIIFVDNGSSVSLKPEQITADKVITNEENKGVAFAWNQAIRASEGEYIVLLNNDALVFDHWLEDIHSALQHLDLVMATPMYGDPFARALESAQRRAVWEGSPITESFSDFKDFSCVGFKKQMIRDLYTFEKANNLPTTDTGLFDETFFAYNEDVDLLRRMDQAGLKYASTKKVPTFHVIGATTNELPDGSKIMDKSKETYAKKYAGIPTVQPTKVSPPQPVTPAEKAAPPPKVEPVDWLLRTEETGDKVFYKHSDGKIHWIQNIEAFQALGFDLNKVKRITSAELWENQVGENISMENVDKFKEPNATV